MGAHPMSGLTDQELSLLRGELLELQEELTARLRTEARQERETDAGPAVLDPMDAAEQEQERSIPHLVRDAEVARLEAINAALARIAAGTYGVSEQSGDPIGAARLLVQPWARFTAEEAQEIDDERRREKHSTL
jgi:DnaK suppressor protein